MERGRFAEFTVDRRRLDTPAPVDFEPHRFMTDRALAIRTLSIARWGEAKAVEILGFSPPMVELQAKLEKAARYREPVLVTGESGVGKELLAEAIYLLGTEGGRPYVSLNCPQYQGDGNLTVSELFGHTRGSFTGAIADRKGAFEQADGGVLFFDEVGDLHLAAQAMLLRALQTGEFRPLGSMHSRSADVRVVAATNRSLNDLVVAKQFRYDLLFRLWNFHLVGPALRDRGDDWRIILEYCLLRLAAKYGIAKHFSATSLQLLERFEWPGNVRQLVSLVTIGYAMADGDTIEPDDFAAEMAQPAEIFETNSATNRVDPRRGAAEPVELYENMIAGRTDFWRGVYEPFMERDLNHEQVRGLIRRGLAECGGSYRRLLDMLRMPSADYQRFMDFLRHHNLKPYRGSSELSEAPVWQTRETT